jgi:hypothetical protein
VKKVGYGNCGVKLVAVCVVNEVALGFREVPEEACGAVPAWVVDDGWAGCKESLHHPDMIEVQDIVGLLVVVATDEEGSQGEVAIRNGVGEDGCEDIAPRPSGLASGSDDSEGHWVEGAVPVEGFVDSPGRDEGVCVLGDVELVWLKEGQEK